jgi:hypothetical protein
MQIPRQDPYAGSLCRIPMQDPYAGSLCRIPMQDPYVGKNPKVHFKELQKNSLCLFKTFNRAIKAVKCYHDAHNDFIMFRKCVVFMQSFLIYRKDLALKFYPWREKNLQLTEGNFFSFLTYFLKTCFTVLKSHVKKTL